MESTEKKQAAGSLVRKLKFNLFGVIFAVGLLLYAHTAYASVLTLSPASGTFTVGSTFSVSVLLNTENESINTVGVTVTYPPDKLQLVSPSTGSSIISLWTSFPKADNQKGQIDLRGGVPGGIKTSGGAVTVLTFRVNAVGSAVIKFSDNSKVFLNDGQGTDSLRQVTNGVYNLVLPPPAGPIVSSDTHPDQSRWYNSSNVVLRWAGDSGADGYSYMLSDSPADIPDDIAEGSVGSVTYRDAADGIHYFHIKSIKNGNWGGTTHFAIKIDTHPPANFPIEIIPEPRTSRREPIVQFASTDALAGVSHYEIKLIPLSVNSNSDEVKQPLFIEATSPFVLPSLDVGDYHVVVRAYDIAGNYREVTAPLSIVTPLFTVVQNEGIHLRNGIVLPWLWVWLMIGIALIVLAFIALEIRRWHHAIVDSRKKRELPENIQQDLDELRKYRAKFGKVVCLLAFTALLFGHSAFAAPVSVTPPIIESLSHTISNEDIFYIGGKTDTADNQVIIYVQNVSTGETITEVVKSDAKGEWFYRHNTFLSSGNYVLWAQTKNGDALSPPSPEEKMQVRTTAFHLGASRLSIETIDLIITIIALSAFAILLIFTFVHAYRGKKQKQLLLKEIQAAEESIRRGFALIRKDVQSELDLIHKVKMSAELSHEEKKREEQLLGDLEKIEQYIGKEVWEIDRLENQM